MGTFCKGICSELRKRNPFTLGLIFLGFHQCRFCEAKRNGWTYWCPFYLSEWPVSALWDELGRWQIWPRSVGFDNLRRLDRFSDKGRTRYFGSYNLVIATITGYARLRKDSAITIPKVIAVFAQLFWIGCKKKSYLPEAWKTYLHLKHQYF